MPHEGFWSALGAALMAFVGGLGIWARGRMQNGRVITMKLEQKDHDMLSNLVASMEQHNKDSSRIIEKLDQVLQAQAEERGRRNG